MYAVVFEECMGSIELINCKSMQVQVLGKVSTVSIDKTDGAQIYLSQGSLNAHVITAKSSEMNVMIPKGDGDFVSVFVGEIMTNIDIQQRRFRLLIRQPHGISPLEYLLSWLLLVDSL
jgi:hypothetical protein